MLKRYIHSTISFIVFAIPSAILIYYLFAEPGYNSPLITICEPLVALDELAEMGITFADVAYDLFILLAWLNVWLLALTYVYIIILDTIHLLIKHTSASRIFDKFSNFIIFRISNWLIKSGIFLILAILFNHIFLNTTIFAGSQYFSAAGVVTLTIYTTIYYLVMFHLILIVKNWLSKKHV